MSFSTLLSSGEIPLNAGGIAVGGGSGICTTGSINGAVDVDMHYDHISIMLKNENLDVGLKLKYFLRNLPLHQLQELMKNNYIMSDIEQEILTRDG